MLFTIKVSRPFKSTTGTDFPAVVWIDDENFIGKAYKNPKGALNAIMRYTGRINEEPEVQIWDTDRQESISFQEAQSRF
jgi:hypothetical protein